jgi:hypothetical protein
MMDTDSAYIFAAETLSEPRSVLREVAARLGGTTEVGLVVEDGLVVDGFKIRLDAIIAVDATTGAVPNVDPKVERGIFNLIGCSNLLCVVTSTE